jgi:hypothetical protein
MPDLPVVGTEFRPHADGLDTLEVAEALALPKAAPSASLNPDGLVHACNAQ